MNQPTTFDFSFPNGRLRIRVLTAQIVRLRWTASEFAPRRSWAVTRPDEEFAALPVQRGEDAETIWLDTGAFRLIIAKADGRLRCVDANGRTFCADAIAPDPAQAVQWIRKQEPGECFYGFGERSGCTLERSGRRWVNWTRDPAHPHGPDVDPMYIAIPVYLAVRPGLAYGIYFNNTFQSEFDLQHELVCFEAKDGELDCYLFYGPRPAQVLQGLSEVLGRMAPPPRWALGYHQSRWSYGDADEVRHLALEFRARRIPCDVIHLDIDHMDGYRDFTWDKQNFPNPKGLLAQLRAWGFRVVTIVDAGVKIDEHYSVFRHGMERNVFIRQANGELAHGYVWPDDAAFCDYLRPEVRAWWAERVRQWAQTGVAGMWCDMNEPVIFDRPFSQGGGGIGTLPLDAQQGTPRERTTHAEGHNLFGLGMARATWEGLAAARPDETPFVLTRSAFAGIQRWSAAWMGDNDSWWEHLEMSLPQLMNMGLSGVPFVGVDIGGFGNNASPELFARWMQIGALYPFCRGHSSAGTQPHEPWAFGPEVEAICRAALELRYQLLPYLQGLFNEASQTGAPVFRPLLYEFPDDPVTYSLHDEVMLGPALLAAPILRPGQQARAVYLPEGEWIDWWSGEVLRGGQHILAQAPLARMPLYQRADQALPLGPLIQYTDELSA